uniref:Uncharacterized protein n=1 Tax=Fagus sylvatica TaxID=28930 RepID=A0A2N9HPY8_FAGSY
MVQEQYIWYAIFNNWHLDGILYLKYGNRIVYDAASKPKAKVDSVIKENQWIWNPARSDDLSDDLMDVQRKLFLVEFKEELKHCSMDCLQFWEVCLCSNLGEA